MWLTPNTPKPRRRHVDDPSLKSIAAILCLTKLDTYAHFSNLRYLFETCVDMFTQLNVIPYQTRGYMALNTRWAWEDAELIWPAVDGGLGVGWQWVSWEFDN